MHMPHAVLDELSQPVFSV